MAAVEAFMPLEKPAAVNETMLVALTARATEPIRPATLLQRSFTLILVAVNSLKLKQESPFWN
jgi:hypothetical protein